MRNITKNMQFLSNIICSIPFSICLTIALFSYLIFNRTLNSIFVNMDISLRFSILILGLIMLFTIWIKEYAPFLAKYHTYSVESEKDQLVYKYVRKWCIVAISLHSIILLASIFLFHSNIGVDLGYAFLLLICMLGTSYCLKYACSEDNIISYETKLDIKEVMISKNNAEAQYATVEIVTTQSETNTITETEVKKQKVKVSIEPDKIFQTGMFAKFQLLEPNLIEDKYLDENLKWLPNNAKTKPDIKALVIFLSKLLSHGYFLPDKDSLIRSYFESRYTITIGQNFEKARREKIENELFKYFVGYDF